MTSSVSGEREIVNWFHKTMRPLTIPPYCFLDKQFELSVNGEARYAANRAQRLSPGTPPSVCLMEMPCLLFFWDASRGRTTGALCQLHSSCSGARYAKQQPSCSSFSWCSSVCNLALAQLPTSRAFERPPSGSGKELSPALQSNSTVRLP